MGKLFLVVLILAAVLVGGCASPRVWTEAENTAAYNAIGKCYESFGAVENARLNKLSDSKDVLLSQSISGLSGAATGGKHPCQSIKTYADVEIAAMQENTKRIGIGADVAKTGGGYLLGAYLGGKVIDGLTSGTQYNINDSNLSNSLNQNNGFGDFNLGTAEPFIVEPTVVEPFVVQ